MAKTKITVEYPLATKSATLVWKLISSARGLQKWMADHVEENGDTITFVWGEPWTQQDIRTSTVIAREPQRYIRLRWDVNDNDEDYWELKISASDFSGNLCLIITDHVEAEDADYMRGVWRHDLERLHTSTGL